MTLNTIDLFRKNQALVSLIHNPKQRLTVDANFFIPPDRRCEASRIPPVKFEYFKSNWINPFINTFEPIFIHEAVYREFISSSIRNFVNNELSKEFPTIIILHDSIFNKDEEIIRSSIENKIAIHTNYNPRIDNNEDRGEVKSLAHIATSDLLYFCSQDAEAIRLIEEAEKLETNLENINALKTYEIFYYLVRVEKVSKDSLKGLYTYIYYLTKRDKANNPSWSVFLEKMDSIYLEGINKELCQDKEIAN